MRWLPKAKKDGKAARMELPPVGDGAPAGREGRLFDLVILTLFLHSAGSINEMIGAFVEKAPGVTGATFVYPLVLDKKRDVLTATALEGLVEPHLERAMEAFQEDLTALEFDILAATGTRVERVAVRPGPVATLSLDRPEERA